MHVHVSEGVCITVHNGVSTESDSVYGCLYNGMCGVW